MYVVEFGQTDADAVPVSQLPWRSLYKGPGGVTYYSKGRSFTVSGKIAMGNALPLPDNRTREVYVEITQGERKGQLVKERHADEGEAPRRVGVTVNLDHLGQDHPLVHKAMELSNTAAEASEQPWGVTQMPQLPLAVIASGQRDIEGAMEEDLALKADQLADEIEGERLLHKFFGLSISDDVTRGLAAQCLRASRLAGRDAAPLQYARGGANADTLLCPGSIPPVQNVDGPRVGSFGDTVFNFTPCI